MLKLYVVIRKNKKESKFPQRHQESQAGINITLQIQIIDEIRESKTKR